MKLVPRHWRKFQHYKDRRPPWIKVHRELLDDRAFMSLAPASMGLAMLLWLLASESESDTVEMSIDDLVFRLRMSQASVEKGLVELTESGFFTDASGMLAECVHVAIPERETEESERTEESREDGALDDGFAGFWDAYDKKRSRPTALRAWGKLAPDEAQRAKILTAVHAYREATPDKQYRKDPTTWLNQQCWEDEIVVSNGAATAKQHSSKEIGKDFANGIEDL